MAKKSVRRSHKKTHTVSRPKKTGDILTIIKGWMFIVAFALMLGMGAVVGTYFNQLLTQAGTVAGAQIEILK